MAETKVRTHKQELEQEDKEIKEHWFKDHVATINTYGDITVLEWAKPGTVIFSIRYVFDQNKMYVSGDLGEAVFKFTEKAFPERIARYGLSYFYEKLKAFSSDKKDFSRVKANEYIDELITQYREDEVEFDRNAYEDLREIVNDSETNEDFVMKMYEFDITKLDNDAWEWVSNIGSVIPMRIRSYLYGLQMAFKK